MMALAFVLVLAASGASTARAYGQVHGDESALLQSHVVSHQPREFKIGEHVLLSGYEGHNITVIGYNGGADRYNLVSKDVGVINNVKGSDMQKMTTPVPPLDDPAAGPVQHILGFEYHAHPVITGRGEKPGTWNVYIPGMGDIPNVDDGSIIRAKSWYQTSSTTPPAKKSKLQALASEMKKVVTTSVDPAEVKRFTLATWLQKRMKANEQSSADIHEGVEKMSAAVEPVAPQVEVSSLQEGATPTAAPVETSAESAEAEQLPSETREPEQSSPDAATLERKSAGKKQKLKKGQMSVQLDVPQTGEKGFGVAVARGMAGVKETKLLVDSIESSGALAEWNAANPRHQIQQGDRVLMINGKGGNAHFLRKQLMNITGSVNLLLERASQQQGNAAQTAVNELSEVMRVGVKGYVKEKLPFSLGDVLINNKDDVTKCSDISSPLYCKTSKKVFGFKCAGWSGRSCLTLDEARCANIKSAPVCNDAKAKFGITCAGWGGSACLEHGAHASLITEAELCTTAKKKLGIDVAGWGGSSCLAPNSSCTGITLAGVCNSAESKLGMSCLGWGGSSCLDHGAEASLITSEPLCKKSYEKFGIEAAGWSGSACLSKAEVSCKAITDPSICNSAWKKLGVSCAGWGGSSCLDHGADARLITTPSICQRSVEALGIASAGWSGTSCLPAGPVRCGNITAPGVCNDASRRFGIDCSGWTGNSCMERSELDCSKVTSQQICQNAEKKLGLKCVWGSEQCFPDTR
mmetsp:Transcript_92310/g.214486  ORF Transcript_92310/g.214486 Transcript_92310/m.214486 type:complete len:749 (-) Transcript_92310:63-2309(-)